MQTKNTSALMLSRRERHPVQRELAEIKRLLDDGYTDLQKITAPLSTVDSLRLGAAQGYIKLAMRRVEAIEREVIR